MFPFFFWGGGRRVLCWEKNPACNIGRKLSWQSISRLEIHFKPWTGRVMQCSESGVISTWKWWTFWVALSWGAVPELNPLRLGRIKKGQRTSWFKRFHGLWLAHENFEIFNLSACCFQCAFEINIFRICTANTYCSSFWRMLVRRLNGQPAAPRCAWVIGTGGGAKGVFLNGHSGGPTVKLSQSAVSQLATTLQPSISRSNLLWGLLVNLDRLW